MRISRQLAVRTIGIIAMSAATAASAQQEITITASRIVDDAWTLNDNDYSPTPGGGGSPCENGCGPASANPVQAEEKTTKSTLNKLCAVPGKQHLARTVSTSDIFMRGDAMRAIVGLNNLTYASQLVWSQVISSGIAINGEKFIQVVIVWADGGTERWYVNPFLTDSARPIPNTLETGNGIPSGIIC